MFSVYTGSSARGMPRFVRCLVVPFNRNANNNQIYLCVNSALSLPAQRVLRVEPRYSSTLKNSTLLGASRAHNFCVKHCATNKSRYPVLILQIPERLDTRVFPIDMFVEHLITVKCLLIFTRCERTLQSKKKCLRARTREKKSVEGICSRKWKADVKKEKRKRKPKKKRG